MQLYKRLCIAPLVHCRTEKKGRGGVRKGVGQGGVRSTGRGRRARTVVLEQTLNQVHVREQHAAAAVALQPERVQGLPV